MKYFLGEILDKNIKDKPKMVQLQLPKLKKMGNNKLKLPKLEANKLKLPKLEAPKLAKFPNL